MSIPNVANDPLSDKNDLVNGIVMDMYTDIGEDNARKLQQVLYMQLTGYEITTKSTEVGLYQKDETQELLKRFAIAKKLKGCSDRTVEFYKDILDHFFEFIQKSPLEVTSDDIRMWMGKRQFKDKVTTVTVNNERRGLSSFFSWMAKEEIRLNNPMLKIGQIKVKREKKKAFDELEIEKMRDVLKNYNDRDKLIFELLLSSWARVTEVAQIRLDEINGDEILVHGKGNKDRTVYLNAKTSVMLENFMKGRKDDNPYLFPSYAGGNVCTMKHIRAETIEQRIRKIGKEAGVQAYPHKFRRTGATMALHRGMPVEQVSRILGHESLDVTKIYLDINDDDVRESHKRYAM
jgi:site-specific recombinase XerD